ncbi:hypothetical protein T229_14825 [Tannerella sp. oral taxon BU063 isolate Cell 5]|uniref:Uncharacterized protein n=1 Tax=Tannerella sp. oral taxon BU063 isolate Cell 5 TaxID=1410950 RepID=W2C813_9BACT|nr:hypothetical protein T229_14825 [Tannerella sp. oral taxon BU063 isolate Cell 5]
MGENRKSGSENPAERGAANCLRKSPATKLFRLISSGNRSPQTFSAHFLRKSLAKNFFGSFPQEIARHKLFRLISSGNRPPQNFFGSFPQEIARHKTFSANCLRKSREKGRCAGRGSRAGYGMYPKRDEENFASGRSPSFLLLIEEKKQKKIKAPGVPAIFGRVQMGDVKSYVPETFSF